MTREYDVWFEIHVFDGFQWEFHSDHDTREDASKYADTRSDWNPEDVHIRRRMGMA